MNSSVNDGHNEKSVNFSELILGFASAALYYTGDTDIEGRKKGEINLDLARYNIDIVRLLHEKTKGNLTEDERQMLETVLADLSLKYSSAVRR